MSYDLEFLRKGAGESWEEAFAAADALRSDAPHVGAARSDALHPGAPDSGAARSEAGGSESPNAEVRAAVTAAARELLGEVEVVEGEHFFELEHGSTGIQLNLYRHSAAITVPYWYTGAEAATIVAQIYALGHIVEQHTGLIGYDPQTALPLADAATKPDLAVQIFDQTAASFARRGIRN